MKRRILSAMCAVCLLQLPTAGMAQQLSSEYEGQPLPGYTQAQRFTKEKLDHMLFSTQVDPHWFQKGNSFWYHYKTSDGDAWYVVDPSARTKRPLFDLDNLASQLTEIAKTPFTAQHLPIKKLEACEDGKTFTFFVESKDGNKVDSLYFAYDYQSRKLNQVEKDSLNKQLDWASISPDGKTVVFAKDLNLYRMSAADYVKAKVNENDSTIVEVQITTDGEPAYGFGEPYSLLNTDTLCNGKRRHPGYLAWSPDSRYFATIRTDERAVKELWVINSMASPRPTLETYKYQMPGNVVLNDL